MKRRELVGHLVEQGCEVLREGGSHAIFVHRAHRRSSSVPRHNEINDFLARKTCRDLGVPAPAA